MPETYIKKRELIYWKQKQE